MIAAAAGDAPADCDSVLLMAMEAIFFDLGGTLLHPDMKRLLQPLLVRRTPSPEQLAEADRAAKHAIPPRVPGQSSGGAAVPGTSINQGHWQVYFEKLLMLLEGCDDLLEELVARAGDSSYWTILDPAAPKTLGLLRQSYRLGVISNADGRIRQLLEQAGIQDCFEQVFDSGLMGCEKPDPRIFRAALTGMGVEATASLYVGDLYGIDYCGATAVGMQAVLLDPAGLYRHWPAASLRALADLPAWIKAGTVPEDR